MPARSSCGSGPFAELTPLRKTIEKLGNRARSTRRALAAVFLVTAAFIVLNPAGILAEIVADGPKTSSHFPAVSGAKAAESNPTTVVPVREPLLVVGFMGGRIHADNLAHGEARLARDLDQRYPDAVHAISFDNHREHDALRTILELLDTNKDGHLSDAEKSAARIILFGHSWGASEAVHLAAELDRRGIPVLLTAQVDSVEKSGENDGTIPPNVREAVNFYQTEGLLHGRQVIQAVDPKRTTILGSYKSSYKGNPVSCDGYGWFARKFMKPHIEIENDHAVWDRIEALIVARFCAGNSLGLASACKESK